MSNIRVELSTVQVTDGQGAGEGDFELRIEVLERTSKGDLSKEVWPSRTGTEKVNNNGTPEQIGREVETYAVNSGSIAKNFVILVTEEDTGTLGQDEGGQGIANFVLAPTMPRTPRPVVVPLNNNGNNEGSVLVLLVAEQV